MSTTTLVNLDVSKEREDALPSTTPTTARNSLEVIRDEEKLPQEQLDDSNDEPEPLSKVRLSLLIMGLTLSIFLVALDFVTIS
jgi:hypothetical protein